MNRRQITLIFDRFEIAYDCHSTLGSLRSHIKTIVANLRVSGYEEQWPQIPSLKLKDDLIYAFKKETSSASLKQYVCACCGKDVFENEYEKVLLKDVNLELFRRSSDDIPFSAPHCNTLLKDLIIHPSRVNVHPLSMFIFNFCHSCWNFLRRDRLPVLALANDTFLGDVPSELQNLSFVEEIMIALCRAKCSIFQLRETKHEGRSVISQTAFRGHILKILHRPRLFYLLLSKTSHLWSALCLLVRLNPL